ncbi:MAG: hypothetical protein Kow0019_12310 [Methanobacteriaceae archaeon]
MKALLLRVGIDKGSDGILGPIFSDGSFEYIPISEMDQNSHETRTYSNTKGRFGQYLSYYLPEKTKNKKIHFDPEFQTFTYGDTKTKAKYLSKLKKDDLIVFYAGLSPFNTQNYNEALYIIGYFTIAKIIEFKKLNEDEKRICSKKYSNNAHIKRSCLEEDLVIVVGNSSQSKLLDRAILISEKKLDKRGRTYHAVIHELERLLKIKGSIQRSIPPRIIKEDEIDNLKKLINIPRK